MVNADNVNQAVETNLALRIEDCERGNVRFERGAKARFLVESEIEKIALETVVGKVPFDLSVFANYVAANPDIVSLSGGIGDFGTQLKSVVHQHMAEKAVERLQESLLNTHRPASLQAVIDDLEATLAEYIDPIRAAQPYSLKNAIDNLQRAPSAEHFEKLREEIASQAYHMRQLILRLDIANPPEACLSAQGWRRLVETNDHLWFLKNKGIFQAA